MDTLEMLGAALGLATLAGLNLYLTVFGTGLAVHFGWVVLPPELAPLAILGNPWVIGISGVLYFLQFFADKVPWIDSINDAVHTAIRPIGGMLLAVLALGEADPAVKVIAALIAGGAALTAHAAKAGVRLAANASPEPVSNVVLSIGEDALVLGGLALIAANPIIAGLIFVLLVVAAWLVLPRLVRGIRAVAWLAWRKLNAPAEPAEIPPARLPAKCELGLRRAHASGNPIADAAFCIGAGGARLPKNLFGWLVHIEGEESALFFVAPRFLKGTMVLQIPIGQRPAERQTRFLAEQLTIFPTDGKPYKFSFDRSAAKALERFAKKCCGAGDTDPQVAEQQVLA